MRQPGPWNPELGTRNPGGEETADDEDEDEGEREGKRPITITSTITSTKGSRSPQAAG